jgi:hypothetical protein
LESIGQDLDLTRERVRQIEVKALSRLDSFSRFHLLCPHYHALNWRGTCAPDDASALIGSPFREFTRDLYDSKSEG